jgi:hypothetical protein
MNPSSLKIPRKRKENEKNTLFFYLAKKDNLCKRNREHKEEQRRRIRIVDKLLITWSWGLTNHKDDETASNRLI